MEHMHTLAAGGHAVLASIHQPRPQNFGLFARESTLAPTTFTLNPKIYTASLLLDTSHSHDLSPVPKPLQENSMSDYHLGVVEGKFRTCCHPLGFALDVGLYPVPSISLVSYECAHIL